MKGTEQMPYCSNCGVNRGSQLRLGDLIVETKPPAAYWRADLLELRPSQVRMLALLLNAKIVSASQLAVAIGSATTTGSVRVLVGRLRKELPIEITIDAVYGLGYRIKANGA